MKEKENISIEDLDFKKNQSGFKSPEGFLDGFEDRMMQSILKEENARSKKTIPLKSWFLYGATVAASIVLGFAIWNFVDQSNTEYQFSEIEWDQVASFDESWILEELMVDDESLEDSYEEIDFLIAQGVTNDEILEVFEETYNLEE